jgi:hypothetical protein
MTKKQSKPFESKLYWIPNEKVEYHDITPWPTSTDGGGHFLDRIEVHMHGRDYSNWQAANPTPGYSKR